MSKKFSKVDLYRIKRILRRFHDYWGINDRANLYWKQKVDVVDDELSTMDDMLRLAAFSSDGLGDDLSELMEVLGIKETSLYECKDDYDEGRLGSYQEHIRNRDERIEKIKKKSRLKVIEG